MGRVSKWSPEFREEAVRLQRESGESITAVARRLGVSPETLRNWVRRDEVERGEGMTIAEHAEIRELRRQIRRLEVNGNGATSTPEPRYREASSGSPPWD